MKNLKKKTSPLENHFKKRVICELRKIPSLYFFTKEAAALRGISDIIGCTPHGQFFAWELKRSKSEIFYRSGEIKLKGRTTLQWYNLKKIREAGGIGEFVYPENFEEKLIEVL